MSRLSIEIDPAQHRQIKTLATFAGLSMKEYILSRALPAQAPAIVGKDSARLRKAISTPSSDHVVFESLEELKNALGI